LYVAWYSPAVAGRFDSVTFVVLPWLVVDVRLAPLTLAAPPPNFSCINMILTGRFTLSHPPDGGGAILDELCHVN
jgi:hypothetical protein